MARYARLLQLLRPPDPVHVVVPTSVVGAQSCWRAAQLLQMTAVFLLSAELIKSSVARFTPNAARGVAFTNCDSSDTRNERSVARGRSPDPIHTVVPTWIVGAQFCWRAMPGCCSCCDRPILFALWSRRPWWEPNPVGALCPAVAAVATARSRMRPPDPVRCVVPTWIVEPQSCWRALPGCCSSCDSPILFALWPSRTSLDARDDARDLRSVWLAPSDSSDVD